MTAARANPSRQEPASTIRRFGNLVSAPITIIPEADELFKRYRVTALPRTFFVTRDGKFVREHFPVNPELLRRMASTTGGDAFIATDKKSLEQSMHQILDKLEKTRFEASTATMEDLFPFLLFPAVALIALEALVRLIVVRRFP